MYCCQSKLFVRIFIAFVVLSFLALPLYQAHFRSNKFRVAKKEDTIWCHTTRGLFKLHLNIDEPNYPKNSVSQLLNMTRAGFFNTKVI